MKKTTILFFIAFLLLANLLEVAGTTALPSQKIPVIVGFEDKSDAGLIGKHAGDIKYQYSAISAIACSLPQEAIQALGRNPRIAYIELDGKVQMAQEELPPGFFPMPFDGVDRIDAEYIHPYHTGTGVKVAILDTGIDYTHIDLDQRFDPDNRGYDFVHNDNDPMDDQGHGTRCAGIVAAEADGSDIIGVAPQASLYGVKVLNSAGGGDVSDIIAGIQWAIDNDVDVISMSLRSTKDYQGLHQVCDAAYDAGILVVAAAGNDYHTRGKKEVDSVGYPARYDSVIAVGATDNTDTRASYSSTGPASELVAPGDDINSTMLDNTYALGSGTSMACPHVAGLAALILSSDSELSASDVRNRLRSNADDLGNPGWDNWYGYGLIDANADPGAPSITKLTPAFGVFINTTAPTISATVTDADGIAPDSISMELDGDTVTPTYDPSSNLVSYEPTLSEQGPHKVALTVSDPLGNSDITSWSFNVDTIIPDQVTGVTVEPISSSSLFISWKTLEDPSVITYKVYRKAPGENEHTWMRLYVSQCSMDEEDDNLGFPDTGLEPGATYSYKISAVDIAGNEGLLSNPAEGKTETPTPGTMRVERIIMDWRYDRGTNQKNKVVSAEADVRLLDETGAPVPGATVHGHWEGATTDSDSVVTDAYGWARITSDKIRNPDEGTTFTFWVDDVVFSGWTYDDSGATSNSITYP